MPSYRPVNLDYNGHRTGINNKYQRLREEIADNFQLIEGESISEIASRMLAQVGPLTASPKGGLSTDIPENIMRIMESSPIFKGKVSYHSSIRSKLLEDIRRFVEQGSPIKFTFLGYPFKNPNLLSTIRIHPDLGEFVMMQHLLNIIASIKLVYTPGATFEILSESFDYRHREVFLDARQNSSAAIDGLKSIINLLDAEYSIIPKDLFNLTSPHKDFDTKMQEHLYKLEELYKRGGLDADTQNLISNTMHKSLNTKRLVGYATIKLKMELDLSRLVAIEEDRFEDIENSKELKEFKEAETVSLALRYQAYHAARAELQVVPDYLKINKDVYIVLREHEGRLGFRAMPEGTHYFSHHGAPVMNKKTGFVQIIRIIDMIKEPSRYTGILCSEDLDGEMPFYFIDNKSA